MCTRVRVCGHACVHAWGGCAERPSRHASWVPCTWFKTHCMLQEKGVILCAVCCLRARVPAVPLPPSSAFRATNPKGYGW